MYTGGRATKMRWPSFLPALIIFPNTWGNCHFYILGRRHNVSVHFLYIGVDQDCLLFRANKRDVLKNKRHVLMFLRIRGMFLLLG